LEKDPANRPKDAAELAERFLAALEGTGFARTSVEPKSRLRTGARIKSEGIDDFAGEAVADRRSRTPVYAAVAVLAAQALRRRRPEPPTQRQWGVPEQLDRNDFTRPDAPWLVVAFTSATCDSCATVVSKVQILDSPQVAVAVLPFHENQDTHVRYGIDAVPTIVIADAEGVVGKSFVGPMSATDLWAAVAELREPGSTPPPEAHTHGGLGGGHGHDDHDHDGHGHAH
jgi:hypothetical protein